MTSNTQEAKQALARATHAAVRPGSRVELLVEQGTSETFEWPELIWSSRDPFIVGLMERFIKKKMTLWEDVGTSRTWFYAQHVSLPTDYYHGSIGCITWSAIWHTRMDNDPNLFEPSQYSRRWEA